jgi:uncharacterized protein (TIGR02145 family)
VSISGLVPYYFMSGVKLNTVLSWSSIGEHIKYDVFLGTNNDLKKIATNITTQYFMVNDLIPNTKYYWSITGWDSISPCKIFSTSTISFITKGTTTPVVLTKPVTKFNSTSVTIGGEIIDNGDDLITEYGIYWSVLQSPVLTGVKRRIGRGTGAFSDTISGLNQNTTYYVKAYATNSAGTSFGAELSFSLNDGSPSVTDSDGNIYNAIKIGDQVWMGENLKTTKSSDGVPIQYANYFLPVSSINASYYCWNNDISEFKHIYGGLYTYTAAMKACPVGWHLPTEAEWRTLASFLGGESVAGGKMKVPGESLWFPPNTGATNESNFSAIAGGYRSSTESSRINESTFFWSSNSLFSPRLLSNYNYLDFVTYSRVPSGLFCSVRCIKD